LIAESATLEDTMTRGIHDPSRRNFLTGAAAAGAATLLRGSALQAQPAKRHGVIDTHHHFYAPEYLKVENAWEDQRHLFHYPAHAKWTPETSLAEMDRGGVQTAVLSLPSVSDSWWGLDAPGASRMARLCGDYATKMMQDHPGRFALFAPLCMLDVDLTLKDIEYAFDTLHADGIGLETSYGDKYPGDPFYKPIYEELNRRKAVVYFHGANPACCSTIKDDTFPPTAEVTFDMTRVVISLLASGSLARYRDIKWLFSYGGGNIPMLAGRIEAFVKQQKNYAEIAPNGVFAELELLHYDTVNVAAPPSWAALTTLVKPTQITYGTDYPYFNNDQLDAIDQRGLSEEDKQAIYSGTAKRLIPRLAKA
jgi:predicted TIM-barrel fold metal-dependent hydrolase